MQTNLKIMDLLLIVLAFLLVISGILGSFLPILPGIPLSWLGLLLLHFTSAIPMNYTFLGITLVVTVIIFILQYTIPAYGTRKFGGSRSGMWGATIGLVVGIFLPIPGGILIGTFAGAFIGELVNKSTSEVALKAAFGSFLGFLASTFMEFFVACCFLLLFCYKLWEYWGVIF